MSWALGLGLVGGGGLLLRVTALLVELTLVRPRVDVTFHASPLVAVGPPPRAPLASGNAGASLLEHHQRDDDD